MTARFSANLQIFAREWALCERVGREARITSLFDQHPVQLGEKVPKSGSTKTQKTETVFAAIDEVGRGSVAGPVFVCATFWRMCPEQHTRRQRQNASVPPKRPAERSLRGKAAATEQTLESLGIRDSKKLREQARVHIYACLSERIVPQSAGACLETAACSDVSNPRTPLLHVQANQNDLLGNTSPAGGICELMFCALGAATVEEIETHNIWGSTQIALCRALSTAEVHLSGSKPAFIVFDGKWASAVPESWESVPFVTLKQADDLLISAGLASVVAKVARDSWMSALEDLHPGYGFARHKGYGTRQHLQAITDHGILGIHRRSFLRRLDPMQRI